jgi:hypothetical protein
MADSAREQQAIDILVRHSGVDVKMYEIPAERGVPTAALLQPAVHSITV